MKDDRLLKDLTRVALEEDKAHRNRLDERWDRLAAGTLSPADEAEIRAMAETSSEGRLAYEAFRPLGESFRASVVATLETRLGGTEAAGAPEVSPPARILPFVRRRAAWLGGSAAAAMAAALVLLIGAPVPPVPGYGVDLAPGVQTLRSGAPEAAEGEPVFVPGSRFDLVLTPATEVAGRLEARFFLEGGGEIAAWDVGHEVSPTGAVRIDGTIGEEVEIAPGRWTLWAVVGRPGELPGLEELSGDLDVSEAWEETWVLEKTSFRVEPGN